MMKKIVANILVLCLISFLAGCVKEYHAKEEAVEKPINCATAESDIKMLQDEKTSTGEKIKAGLQSIAPPALIGGLLTGTTETKGEIAIGEYDKMIDEKIAEIKSTCGVD